MKKIIYSLQVFIVSLLMIISVVNVSAASLTIRSSNSKPIIGNTFKVTVNVSGYVGKFNFSCSSNLKIDKSSEWLENSSTIITVTAVSEGPGTVSVSTENVSTTDANPQPVSLTKSVSVTVVNSTNNGSSNGGSGTSNNTTPSQNTSDNRSGVNTLSSLSISNGTLSPEFKENITSYSASLPAGTTEVTISAKAKNSKATVAGTGKKTVRVGENKFSIVCTAENGAKKYYSVTLTVDDAPTLYTELNDVKLGFVTNLSDVKIPNGFVKTTTTFDSKEVTCWTNEKTKLTIVYLQTDDNKKDFYIFEDGKVIRKYETITVLGKEYVVVDIPSSLDVQSGLAKSTIKIGELELLGWTFDDQTMSQYSIVYLMNDEGELNLYSYEASEGTLQKYQTPEIEKVDYTLTYVFIATTVLFALTSIGLAFSFMKFKKKSISAIKDYYDRKNQG